MKTFHKSRILWLLLIGSSFLTIVSCTKEEDNTNDSTENTNEYLISYENKFVLTEDMIEGMFQYPGLEEAIINGIISKNIIYKTTYNGEEIEASGTLSFPGTSGTYALALVEHGTILSNSAAPSESAFPSYEIFAGMGFIVFVPDLIGYGASNHILHPYFDYEYTASASIDMYRAVVEFFNEYDDVTITLDTDFFISGYSQGGFSAMATYKYISENVNDITVTAVGVGAGGYDVMSIVENVLAEDTYAKPILLSMPLVTYNELYTQKPLIDIFNSPYDAMIQEVINGEKEWNDIDESLPNVIAELFNSDLINGLKNGENTFLTQTITDNSVHDWAPQQPTMFYHYPLDEIIPIESTYATFETMENKGASDIHFVAIPDSLLTEGPSAHANAAIASYFLSFTEFKNY